MIYAITTIIILFIIFLIILIYCDQVSKIDNIKIKLDEAIKNISITQEKEIKILTKINKEFQKQYDKKNIINLSKIKNKTLNIFELDKELVQLNNDLKNFIEDNNINFSDNTNELHSTIIELKSLKLFYNEYTRKYNNTISSFKYILIKIIQKERKKELFEVQKEIEFEILKNNDKKQ